MIIKKLLNLEGGIKIRISSLVSVLILILYPASIVLNHYGIFTTVVNVFVLALGVFCFLKLLVRKNKDSVFYWWTLFFFINVFYYFFFQSYDPTAKGKMASISLVGVTFYTFYFLGKVVGADDRLMLRLFVFTLICAIFVHFDAILSKRVMRSELNVVVNTSYVFAYLVPFLFFIRNKVQALVALSVIFFMLILGAKRGAILVGGVGSFFIIYYFFVSLRGDKRAIVNRIFLGVVSVFLFGMAVFYFFSTYGYLLSRFSDLAEGDGGSGRDLMYGRILSSWVSSEGYLNKLFGFGFSASRSHTGNGLYAHNDWLEALINFGVIGAALYGMFWIFCFNMIFRNFSISRLDKFQILSTLMICIVASLFSMVYSASNSAIYAIGLLGYLIGKLGSNVASPHERVAR